MIDQHNFFIFFTKYQRAVEQGRLVNRQSISVEQLTVIFRMRGVVCYCVLERKLWLSASQPT